MVVDSLAKNHIDHAHDLVTFAQPPVHAFADDFTDVIRTRRTCA